MATIFLDRDGVINENRPDYVKNWGEFCFVPGAREAIVALTQAGHRIVVCTNQAGIAKGIIACDTLEDIHRRMLAGIRSVGGCIEKVYYCPHSKDAQCICRKPHPGLLLRARDELDLNMHDALFIGDSITDIRAGLAAGVHGMLVLTGLGREQLRHHSHEAGGPFLVMVDLKHAAQIIIQGSLSLFIIALAKTCP
jgi:histidinol-phosphate phosphatase family protein